LKEALGQRGVLDLVNYIAYGDANQQPFMHQVLKTILDDKNLQQKSNGGKSFQNMSMS